MEPSTIALSVHNAIVALDRPATAEQIAQFLRVQWEQVTEPEVDAAITALIGMQKIVADGGRFDTFVRVNGRRQMIRVREREDDGWKF